MRSAQHFNPADIEQIVHRKASALAINAIDEHADCAFKAWIVAGGADAADPDGRAAGFGIGVLDQECGGDALKIGGGHHIAAVKLFFADRGDRDWRVLQGLLPPRGGNQDFFVVFNRCSLLGVSRLNRRTHG